MSKVLLLGLILLLAVFVRVWGLDYGLPYFLIDDERALAYGALKMGELKILIPALYPEAFHMLNYKYNLLMPYIYLIFLTPFMLTQYFIGSFANFVELANHFTLNPTNMWLVARLVNALMGVSTVYLIYLIGKKIGNSWVGLIAALFLTFNFLHIQFSHFTRPWVPMVFFTCLVMLLSAYIYQSPQRKHYLWMGLALGLASGVSSANAVVIIIFFLAHFMSKESSFMKKLRDKNLWLALAVFALLATAFLLVNPQGFSALAFGGGNLTMAKGIVSYLQGFISYFKVLFFYQPIVAIFSLLGLIILWFKSKKIFLISLFWPVFYITSLYLFSFGEFSRSIPRYIILIVPWIIVLASFAVYYFVSMFKHYRLIKIIILVLVFVCPIATAVQYDYLLSQKDTRILAKDWVEENIPAGTKIISNWSYINPIPTKQAILFQKALDESSLRVADQVLLSLNNEDYPQPAYNILRWAYLDKERPLPDRDYQYFLVTGWQENELSLAEKLLIEKAQLIQEFKQGQVKKVENINGDFVWPISILFSLERLGPTVRIYEL